MNNATVIVLTLITIVLLVISYWSGRIQERMNQNELSTKAGR